MPLDAGFLQQRLAGIISPLDNPIRKMVHSLWIGWQAQPISRQS
jgi:hypothetical protein